MQPIYLLRMVNPADFSIVHEYLVDLLVYVHDLQLKGECPDSFR